MTSDHVPPAQGDPILVERVAAHSVPYWVNLGITVEQAVAPGRLLLQMPFQPALGSRRTDFIHGGAIASLIDACAGGSVITLIGGDEDYGGQATLDLNVTFLNAATGDLVAEGSVLRSSKTIAFTQVDVRMRDGTLVATGRATFSIRRTR